MAPSFALSFIILSLGTGAFNADDSMNTTQCHLCIEDDFDLCMNHPEIQNCTSPATDSCFSAAGRYKFTNGSTDVHVAVAQGCIACPNVTEGCKTFTAKFNSHNDSLLLDCNIECCKGDLCNNQTVSLKPTDSAVSGEPTAAGHPSNSQTVSLKPTDGPVYGEATTAGHLSHYTAVLAFATIIADFFFLLI